MKDQRNFKRFVIELDAKYLLEENPKEWKGCTVVNVSRGGMGIEIYLQEKVPIGSMLQIEITISSKDDPIITAGVLRWIKELVEDKNYLGGVEFAEIDAEDKWKLLDLAYDNWSEEEEKEEEKE
jgi:c-di-GMP-binding flagellar brake protein YcgR